MRSIQKTTVFLVWLWLLPCIGCQTKKSCVITIPNDFEGGIVVVQDATASVLEHTGTGYVLDIPTNGVFRTKTNPFRGLVDIVVKRSDGTPLIVTLNPYDDFRDQVGFRVCTSEGGDAVNDHQRFYVGTAIDLEAFDFDSHFANDIRR